MLHIQLRLFIVPKLDLVAHAHRIWFIIFWEIFLVGSNLIFDLPNLAPWSRASPNRARKFQKSNHLIPLPCLIMIPSTLSTTEISPKFSWPCHFSINFVTATSISRPGNTLDAILLGGAVYQSKALGLGFLFLTCARGFSKVRISQLFVLKFWWYHQNSYVALVLSPGRAARD